MKLTVPHFYDFKILLMKIIKIAKLLKINKMIKRNLYHKINKSFQNILHFDRIIKIL